MGNFRNFLHIVFSTKPPEKIQGSETTFGKFQSILTLTSVGMRIKKQSTTSNSLRNPYNSVFHPFDGELCKAHAPDAGYLP